MTFDEVWAKTDAVCGLFLKEEARALYNAARLVPRNGVVVELGPMFGRSTTVLAEVGRIKKHLVYTIDCLAVAGESQKEALEKNVLSKYKDVLFIESTTEDAANSWGRSIDLLFIDADHQEQNIRKDCENWIKHVKKGGFVAFHDYINTQFPSVQKWADHFTSEWEEVARAESILIRKNV